MKTNSLVYRLIRAALAMCMVFTLGPAPALANTMAPQASQPVGLGPKGIAIGDVNGDGNLDIVTANYRGRSFTVLFGDGLGSFDTTVEVPVAEPSAPASVRLEDVEKGDGGRKEIIIGDGIRHQMRLYHFLGGTNFEEYVDLPGWGNGVPTGEGPESALFDFDSGPSDFNVTTPSEPHTGLLVPIYSYSYLDNTEGGFLLYRAYPNEPTDDLGSITMGKLGPVASMRNVRGVTRTQAGWPQWQSSWFLNGVADPLKQIAGNAGLEGMLGVTSTGELASSSNQGVSWSSIVEAKDSKTFTDVSLSGLSGLACGAKGEVWSVSFNLAGTVVGAEALPVDKEPDTTLRSIASWSSGSAVAVGDSGLVMAVASGARRFVTTDGNANYTDVAVDPTGSRGIVLSNEGVHIMSPVPSIPSSLAVTAQQYNAVAFATTSTAVAVGNDGRIDRTTDGGLTWAPASSAATETLKDVKFFSPSLGYAVGDKGTVLVSTDTGASWNAESISPYIWQMTLDQIGGVGNPFTGAIGDVTGDKYPDFAVAGFGNNTFMPWFFGAQHYPILDWTNGQGFSNSIIVQNIRDLAVGDLNGDSLSDVVAAGYGIGQVGVSYQSSINGISNQPATLLPSGGATDTAPVSLGISDFNSDGFNDLAVVNSYNDGKSPSLRSVGSVGFFKQDPLDNSLKYVGEVDVKRQPAGIAIGDLDKDGSNEAVVTNNVDDNIQVLKYGLPLAPKILSSSHPNQNQYYSSPIFMGTFVTPADFDGIEGYYYVVDRSPSTVPTSGSEFSTNGSPIVNLSQLSAERAEPSVVGTWYVHALSLDRKQNRGVEVAHRQILVDNEPPTAPQPDDGVLGWNASPRRTFNWGASSDGLSGFDRYCVSLDGSPEVEQFVMKYTADGLEDGVHKFTVRARDKAGNYSDYGTDWVYVDAFAPSIEVTGLPQVVSPDTQFSVVASDKADVRRIEWRIDGNSVATDSVDPSRDASISSGSITVARSHVFDLRPEDYASGVHTLTVTAYDTLEHTATVTKTFTLDTPAPTVLSVSHPSENNYYNTSIFNGQIVPPASFSGIDGFHYVVDRNPSTVPTIGAEYSRDGAITKMLSALAIESGETSANGTWYLHAVSQDTKGRMGTSAVHRKIMVDLTLPSAPLVDDNVASYTANSARTFIWPSSSDTYSGTDIYRVSLDGSPESTQTATMYTADGLSDGAHVFTVRARDKAGNFSALGSHTAYVDAEAPSIDVTGLPAMVGPETTFTVVAADKAEVRKVVWSVDTTGVATDTVAAKSITLDHKFDLSKYSSGDHTLTVTAYDTLDHTTSTQKRFTLDTPAPTILSSSHSNENLYYDTPLFSAVILGPGDFKGIDGFHYVIDRSPSTVPTIGCEFDQDGVLTANLVALADPPTVAAADGTWWIHAVAIDSKGRVSSGVTHRQILLDMTPAGVPSPDDGVATYTATPSRTFTWGAVNDSLSGFDAYLIRVDEATETAQTTTKYTATGLSDGLHTFYVRSRDKAGNLSVAGSHDAYVDVEPPSIDVTGLPTTVSSNTSFTVNATDKAEVRRVEMYVDDVLLATDTVKAKSVTVSHKFDLKNYPNGTHTFKAIAYDTLEHTATVSRDFSLEPPAVTITSLSHPDELNYYSAPIFSAVMTMPTDFGAVDGYYYSIDPTATSSVSSDTAEFSPDGTVNVRLAPLGLGFGLPSDGIWYLHAVPRDSNGRVGTTVTHRKLLVDLTPAQTPAPDDNVATYTVSPVRTFNWPACADALSGFDRYLVSLDGAPETLQTATKYTADGLSDGVHTLSVRSKDKAGNLSAYGTHQAFVDAEAPSVEVTGLPWLVSQSSVFNVIADDKAEVRRVEFFIDTTQVATENVAAKHVNLSKKLDLSSFAYGDHTFKAIAYDTLEHTATVTQKFVLGTPAPVITSSTHASEDRYYKSPLFAALLSVTTDFTDVDGYHYVIDRSPNTTPTAADEFTPDGSLAANLDAISFGLGEPSADGTWYLHAVSRDTKGRVGAIPTHRRILFDETLPETPVPDDFETTYTATPARTFTWPACTDALSGFDAYLVGMDGAAPVAQTATKYTATGLTDGAHTFYVQTRDKAGNLSPNGTHTAYIDVQPPSIIATEVPAVANSNSLFKVIATDKAEVRRVEMYVDGDLLTSDTVAAKSVAITHKLDLSTYLNGVHTFSAIAYDTLGHTATVTQDFSLEPPQLLIGSVSHPNPDAYSSSQYLIASMATPPDFGAVDGYYYSIDQSATSAVTSDTAEYTNDGTINVKLSTRAIMLGLPLDGIWYLHAVPRDANGRMGSIPTHRKFMVDLTPAETPAPDDGVATYTAVPARTFNWASCNDIASVGTFASGFDQYYISLDSGTESRQTATRYTADGLSDGIHTLGVRSRDKAGNFSPSGTHLIYVDSEAPTVTIDSPPASVSTNATFTIIASDKAEVRRVELFVDGSPSPIATDAVAAKYVRLDKGLYLGALSYGAHTLTAVAYDTLDHAATSTVSFTRYSPTLTITSSTHPDQTNYYNPSTALARFSAPADYAGVDGFFYTVDRFASTTPTEGSEFTPDGTISVNLRALSIESQEASPDGAWYIHAVTRDPAGHVGALASHRRLLLDTAGPSAPVVDDGVASYTALPARTFTWGASTDNLSGFNAFHVSVDGSAENTQAAMKYTADSLTDGAHVVSVRASDKAGNYSAAGLHTAYIDVEAPSVEVTSLPALVSPNTTFTVVAQDKAEVRRVEMYVDGNLVAQQAFSAKKVTMAQTLDLRTYLNGTHTFSTVAYDTLNHPATASQTFRLDPPAPGITSITHPVEALSYASWYFTGNLVAPASYDGADGFFYVIDRTSGTVPNGASQYSATGVLTNVNLNALAWAMGLSKPDGTWYIHAVTRDSSGRIGTVATQRAIRIDTTPPSSGGGGSGGGPDTTPPTAPIPDDGVTGYNNVPARTFTWPASTDSLSGVEGYYVSIDGGPETQQTITKFTADGLSDGVHTFRVRARDVAGNYSEYGVHQAFVDVDAPQVQLVSLPAIAGPDTTFTVLATDTAGVTRVTLSVDGVKLADQTFSSTLVNFAKKFDLSKLTVGSHSFSATAYDQYGHITTSSGTFKLDPPAPTVASSSHPLETSYYNPRLFNALVDIPANYGIEGYYYTIDRSASTMPTAGADYSADPTLLVSLPSLAFELGLTSPDGAWYLHMISRDYQGRIGSVALHRKILLDTGVPTTPSPDDGISGYSEIANRTFRWSASTDSLSGMGVYRVSIDGAAETTTTATKYTTDALSDGAHTFKIRARDKAGNFSSYGTHTAYVDSDAPSVALKTVPSVAARYATFAVSAADGAAVASVRMYVDGDRLSSTSVSGPSATVSKKLDLVDFRNGTHTFTAVVIDKLGHTTAESRNFKLDKSAPTLSNVSQTRSPFYPRLRDGYKDNFTVKFTTSEAGTATLTLKSASGATVRTIKKKVYSGSNSITWDGAPTTGDVVAGSYRWYLKQNDKVGNVSSTRSGSITISFYELVKTGKNSVRLVER